MERKRRGVLQRFQIDEDGFRLRVPGVIFQHVALLDIHFVSQADHARHSEVLPGGDVAHGVSGKIPGLGDVRDRPPGNLALGEKGGGEVVRSGGVARGVRPDDPDPGLPNGPSESLLQLFSLFIHLGKTSRRQDDRLDSPGRTIPDRLGVEAGGKDNHGQIDSSRQVLY